MSYTLQALLASPACLTTVCVNDSRLMVVALTDTLSLLPLPKSIHDGRGQKFLNFDADFPFYLLKDWVRDAAVAASTIAPIAYVEAEYFGGVGYQSVVLWQGGHIALGPMLAWQLPLSEMPINRVLRTLGVAKGDALDEFEAAGLGKHRSTEAWAGR
jgi:hypothetical protein